jgi:hypothetical protein
MFRRRRVANAAQVTRSLIQINFVRGNQDPSA